VAAAGTGASSALILAALASQAVLLAHQDVFTITDRSFPLEYGNRCTRL